MYRIKSNGNVNLAINDIKISVSASNTNGILVEKEKIDNSKDAQKLIASNLLIVEEEKITLKPSKQTQKGKNTNEHTVFVTEGDLNINPEDVFVRQPERKSEAVKVEEVISKNIKEDVEVVVDAPDVVAEVNIEESTTELNAKVIAEEVKVVEEKNETKKQHSNGKKKK